MVLQGTRTDGDDDGPSLHRLSALLTLRDRQGDLAWAHGSNRQQSPEITETQVYIFCIRFFASIACDEHE